MATALSEHEYDESSVRKTTLQEMVASMSEAGSAVTTVEHASAKSSDDLSVETAIAPPDFEPTFSETIRTDGGATGDIGEALNSAAKLMVNVLSNQTVDLSVEQPSVAESVNDNAVSTTIQQTTNVQTQSTTLSSTTSISNNAPRIQQHIMFSYARTSEESCRQICNRLKTLKYKVWMDVNDMRDNFIDGMASAIRKSYLVIMCIDRHYGSRPWCKKEAEDIAIKQIKFIPCFMVTPFIPDEPWLDFIIGANVHVDFSDPTKFEESFQILLGEITFVESKLKINPRESPPSTPVDDTSSISVSPTSVSNFSPLTTAQFDNIAHSFKTWVEDHHHELTRTNREQSLYLLQQLRRSLQCDEPQLNDQNAEEYIQQLLRIISGGPSNMNSQGRNDFATIGYPIIKGFLLVMTLWAVKVIIQTK